MTTAEMRAQAHRVFLRLAPAVVACDGEVDRERALLGDPSLGITGEPWAVAEWELYQYYLREIGLREAATSAGALQSVLHSSACIAVALHAGET